jgi:hypothetical protein
LFSSCDVCTEIDDILVYEVGWKDNQQENESGDHDVKKRRVPRSVGGVDCHLPNAIGEKKSTTPSPMSVFK